MKLYAILTLVLFLTMLFVPLFSLLGNVESQNITTLTTSHSQATPEAQEKNISENDNSQVRTEKEKDNDKNNKSVETEGSISVARVSSGRVETVPLTDYVIGCVACEMPPSYHIEALKAQAIVSLTYALYQRSQKNNPDISDDPSVHQAYKTYEELKEKWGDSYDKSIAVIKKAVNDVVGQYLTFDGELIKPPYFALSSGATNSAEDVWGSKVEWLVSVTSDQDKLSPSVRSVFEYSEAELIRLLKSECDIDKISIGRCDTTRSGYVKSIEISSHSFSGEQLRGLLSLRSGNFTVEKKDDSYIFTCMGYGHGVGMSQNGANCMAKQGSDYKEILSHYYPGTQIQAS